MRPKKLNLTENREEKLVPAFQKMPFTCYTNIFGMDTFDYIDWHWHSDVQFCIVLDGTINFRVGEHSYTVDKGQGIFIPSYLVHMARAISQDKKLGVNRSGGHAYQDSEKQPGYFCLDINLARLLPPKSDVSQESTDLEVSQSSLDFELSQDSCEPDDSLNHAMILDSRNHSEILKALDSLRGNYLNPSEDSELLMYSELFKLWYLTVRCMKSQEQEDAESKHSDIQLNTRLRIILSYIHEHYMEKITLEEVAAQVHLSTSECCRFFKQMLGQTIFEYLQQYRIQISKDLLKDRELSIADVAYASGFNSQSYFTSVFRREIGCTPTQYMRDRIIN